MIFPIYTFIQVYTIIQDHRVGRLIFQFFVPERRVFLKLSLYNAKNTKNATARERQEREKRESARNASKEYVLKRERARSLKDLRKDSAVNIIVYFSVMFYIYLRSEIYVEFDCEKYIK